MRNEHGYALFLTLLTIVFISIVGVGLLTTTVNSNQITVHERQDQALYYIAEAGINYSKTEVIRMIYEKTNSAVSYINDLPALERTQTAFQTKLLSELKSEFCFQVTDTECGRFAKLYQDFSLQNGKQPTAIVNSTFQCAEENSTTMCEIKLFSKGYIVGEEVSNRKLEQILKFDLNRLAGIKTESMEGQTINPKPSPEKLIEVIRGFAALSSNSITIEEKGKLYGNIGSLQGNSSIIDRAKDNETKKIDVSNFKNLDFNILLPPFPEYPKNKYSGNNSNVPSYNLNELGTPTNVVIEEQSGYLNSNILNLSSKNYYSMNELNITGKNLEIRTGNQDVYLVVNKLNIDSKDIIVTGVGKLHLIVKDTMNLEGKVNSGGNTDQLNIYYSSNKSLLIEDGSLKVTGNLIINDTVVTIKNSPDFFGDIFMNKGTLNINGSMRIRNMYLNEVGVTFNASPTIQQNFFLNKGNVLIINSPDFKGMYTQLQGSLTAKSGTNFYGNMYLGHVNLVTENYLDFYKDLYIQKGDATFKNTVDVKGNLYMLDGAMLSTGYVDVTGNIFYAGTQGVIINKFVDIKKQTLIIAPNATVTIDGSADVKGTVVAKDIWVKDGYIKYEKPLHIDDYYNETPIPQDNTVIFTPLNDFINESPLIER